MAETPRNSLPPPAEPSPLAEPQVEAPPLAVIIPPDVVNEVCEWMLQGHSAFTIAKGVEHRFPGFHRDSVLQAAADHFANAGYADGAPIRGFCIEAYRELYRKALRDGDLQLALAAIKALEKTASR